MLSFSDNEKKVIICLLTQIMNVDFIISDDEVKYIEWVRNNFDISQEVFNNGLDYNPNQALQLLKCMSDEKKSAVCKMIKTIGEIDGYPFDETKEAVEYIIVHARLLESVKRYPNPF